MEVRALLIEADFLNKSFSEEQSAELMASGKSARRFKVDADLMAKWFATQVDEFWHTDKDELEYFQYFSDGGYFCQRRKTIYDFKTNSSYKKSYSFTGATSAQAEALFKQCQDFFYVLKEVKDLKVEEKVTGIDDAVVFWEQRWRKLLRQRNNMLGLSDWRVLPDIAEKYTGEKDDWVKWRQWLRDYTVPVPTDPMFEGSGLKYFKHTFDLKFPIDPSNYRKLYPNGKLDDGVTDAPAFMDENDADQWVKHDGEASTDFWKSREENMYRLATRGVPDSKKITDNILQLMRELEVEKIVPVNWSKFHVDENEL